MRQEGYYWVKVDDEWRVAFCYKSIADRILWALPGLLNRFEDYELMEIDERRITRE